MKIIRKAKVEAVTRGETDYVRVQAIGTGPMDSGQTAAQLYFSISTDLAPKPGQLIEFLIEWEAPSA